MTNYEESFCFHRIEFQPSWKMWKTLILKQIFKNSVLVSVQSVQSHCNLPSNNHTTCPVEIGDRPTDKIDKQTHWPRTRMCPILHTHTHCIMNCHCGYI